jgi:hypothetical protein
LIRIFSRTVGRRDPTRRLWRYAVAAGEQLAKPGSDALPHVTRTLIKGLRDGTQIETELVVSQAAFERRCG